MAELEITMLRPGRPGSIVMSGGDIDNRLKTLLDSLKVPSDPSELPKNAAPGSEERPFLCLLGDDKLITKLTVRTDRLLETAVENEVLLLIRIESKDTRAQAASLGPH